MALAASLVSSSADINERPFRYERKFMVEQLSSRQILAVVKLAPGMLYQPYPPRYVNNLYLDTPELANYYDNLNGAMQRTKVRIRWYGDLFGKIKSPVLEFKIKDGFVGTKRQFPLVSFTFDKRFNERYLQGMLAESGLPGRLHYALREQSVVLCNRYYRWYFVTRDGAYRVTLDDGLSFYRVGRNSNNFAHRQVNFRERIVEMKYDVERDSGAVRLAGYFPFRVTKSSKYVQGIERVYI